MLNKFTLTGFRGSSTDVHLCMSEASKIERNILDCSVPVPFVGEMVVWFLRSL